MSIIAQNANDANIIDGIVVEASTGKPIQGVSIHAMGTSIVTGTNADGSFRLERVSAGPVLLCATFLGFESTCLKVWVQSDKKILPVYLTLRDEWPDWKYRTCPEDWLQINAKNFVAFRIPNNMKAIGSGSLIRFYASSEIEIFFDFEHYSESKQRDATFDERQVVIGCRMTKLRRFQDPKQEHGLTNAVSGDFGPSFTMYVWYRDSTKAEIALKILYSVRFPNE